MPPHTLPSDLRHRVVTTLDVTTIGSADPRDARITAATVALYDLADDTTYGETTYASRDRSTPVDTDTLRAIVDRIDAYTDLRGHDDYGTPLAVRDAPRYLGALDAESRRHNLGRWAAPTYVLDVSVLTAAFESIADREAGADPIGLSLSRLLRGVSGILDTCDPQVIHEAQGAWYASQCRARAARAARLGDVEGAARIRDLSRGWPQGS